MAIRVYKPTTPARRHTSVDRFDDVTKTTPEKSLITIKKRSGGRNVSGKVTVRHRGGGAKRFIRMVDFNRAKLDMPATVIAIEYDPNRRARLALLEYADGVKSYIVAPIDLHVGATVLSATTRTEIQPGNHMPLEHMPLGTMVYNIELFPGKGGQLVRSAGVGAKLMALENGFATLKLPSSEVRMVAQICRATIGQVSNPDAMHVRFGKAGRMRHKGVKPTVRGKAMNPVDHPHGGGEGHNPIGMKAPKTPWGKPALGVPTRKPKKYSNSFIVRRRISKKKK